jgi:hypothetical protein
VSKPSFPKSIFHFHALFDWKIGSSLEVAEVAEIAEIA